MPHAEDTMTAPQVNGDVHASQSQFLSHVLSYPVVSDGIETYKRNPYGARSLSYADHGYASLVKPVLPYAQKPYGFVAPYVSRADQLAAGGLDTVDAHFPLITKDTATIKDTAWSYAMFPLHKADETKTYVLGTWGQEVQRHGGHGVLASPKALVATGLTVSGDFLAAVSAFLTRTKSQAEAAVKEKKSK